MYQGGQNCHRGHDIVRDSAIFQLDAIGEQVEFHGDERIFQL